MVVDRATLDAQITNRLIARSVGVCHMFAEHEVPITDPHLSELDGTLDMHWPRE
ncbi:hypothetical protein NOV72_01820 [Caballeronia novacaledonica]|uniref:Uncharacterized protein n=1 Tax=Caballeronia novacaledonica TaxID=1544861 RepID=A0A2U3I392_9BURK|nr:hypothetical protein NOV72_01820 [Caballeronia novacaledonica]